MSRTKATFTTALIFITFLFFTLMSEIENNSSEISDVNAALEEVSSSVNVINETLNL